MWDTDSVITVSATADMGMVAITAETIGIMVTITEAMGTVGTATDIGTDTVAGSVSAW